MSKQEGKFKQSPEWYLVYQMKSIHCKPRRS